VGAALLERDMERYLVWARDMPFATNLQSVMRTWVVYLLGPMVKVAASAVLSRCHDIKLVHSFR
jgi:hypothetical protein